MFNSLKNKIIIPSLAVLLILVVVLVIYAAIGIHRLAGELTEERVAGATATAAARLADFEERTLLVAMSAAGDAAVVSNLQNWNAAYNQSESRLAMLARLNTLKAEFGAQAFVVRDNGQHIIVRTHQPDLYGDFNAGPAHVGALERGEISTAYNVTATMPMGIATNVPIHGDDGSIIGVMSVLFFLDSDEFVDSFAEILNAAVTIYGAEFGGDGTMIRLATTIRDTAGRRTVGTVLDSDAVVENVVERGRPYSIETHFFGEPHDVFFTPLVSAGGATLGMLSVGFSTAAAEDASGRLLRNMIIMGLVGLIGSVVIMFLLITRLMKPLENLSRNVEDVANGNINVNIDRTNLTKDEIGTISRNIGNLVEVIKDMVNDISLFSHEVMVNGDIEYTIEASKYSGSYNEMIIALNDFSQSYTKDMLIILDILANVNKGDFNAVIKKLPGKKVILNTTMDELLENLKGVSAEVNTMIDAAANKGDLRSRADTDKYSGEWREIISGLNRIAEAVDAPINEIRDVMDNLSRGDFSVKVSGNYAGDFMKIKNAVNSTIDTLSIYISEITNDLAAISAGDLTTSITREYVGSFGSIKESLNNISTTLNKTMSEISSASEQVLSGAKQISASAQDLANGAQEQASSVEELNASIDVINQQTQQNAANAATASGLSRKSTENANAGAQTMKQMLEAMDNIKESSNEISKIIKSIEDITFQTNLLSLNASVEAARAGEHGRGFAVVADEVRNLAGKSQQSTVETTSLIGDSISRVEAGSSIASATSESLSIIVKNANEILEIIDAISVSSKEQAESIQQISQGLAQISSVVQSNSAVSEETAAASQELNSQAEVLKQLVAYFKL